MSFDKLAAIASVLFDCGEIALQVGELRLEQVALVLEVVGGGVEGLEFLEADVEFALQLSQLLALSFDKLAAITSVLFDCGEIALQVGQLRLEQVALIYDRFSLAQLVVDCLADGGFRQGWRCRVELDTTGARISQSFLQCISNEGNRNIPYAKAAGKAAAPIAILAKHGRV